MKLKPFAKLFWLGVMLVPLLAVSCRTNDDPPANLAHTHFYCHHCHYHHPFHHAHYHRYSHHHHYQPAPPPPRTRPTVERPRPPRPPAPLPQPPRVPDELPSRPRPPK